MTSIGWEWSAPPALDEVLVREWLVTDGLGGYVAGTLGGCNTRRYHALLIACTPALGRVVMVARAEEELVVGTTRVRLDSEERADGSIACPLESLRRFQLDGLIPTWEYEAAGVRLRRRVLGVHGSACMYLVHEHLAGPAATLRLRPYCAARPHDEAFPSEPLQGSAEREGDAWRVTMPRAGAPTVWLHAVANAARIVDAPAHSAPLLYRVERRRGYDHVETLWSPGYIELPLAPGATVALVASCAREDPRSPEDALEREREREARLLARAPAHLRAGVAAQLVLAADQFIMEPINRPSDQRLAKWRGKECKSVIAGYHWFTEWGRDTMISLEGLALVTGRHAEAEATLHMFAGHVADGLIPNYFPEGVQRGVYHTADATLWFFHALARYRAHTGDAALVRELFPLLEDIIARHLNGTRFGIRIDADDGLLAQGTPDLPLTWMDAHVGGWVVTPRRGKAVELNALWYNAVRWMAAWATELGRDPQPYVDAAARTARAFDERFWNPASRCLYDVIDGEAPELDRALRPNQIFAISLDHAVLDRAKWDDVLDAVRDHLVTGVGLRTLARGDREYKPAYDGDRRARDAAYHQGTVWPWLLGHYRDACRKAGRVVDHVDRLAAHLREVCVGQLGEIFDAEEPHRARGCVAQAWSVAELLRMLADNGDLNAR